MKLSSPVLSYWPEVEIVVLSKIYFSMFKESICGGGQGDGRAVGCFILSILKGKNKKPLIKRLKMK